MEKYIDREKLRMYPLRREFCDKENANPHFIYGVESLMEYVEGMPAADVAPVVHGMWAHLGGDEWCCLVCGFVITTEGSWDKPTKKYCEDCGAKMDFGGSD